MNAKDKATAIVKQFWMVIPFHKPLAIKLAVIHVKGIIEVLNDTTTSNHKYSKLVFYHSVLKELNQM